MERPGLSYVRYGFHEYYSVDHVEVQRALLAIGSAQVQTWSEILDGQVCMIFLMNTLLPIIPMAQDR